MGCDIHPHLELRDPKTGKWREAEPLDLGPRYQGDRRTKRHPFDDRNYSVFGFLTGTVRDRDVKHLVDAPRGVPKDSPLYAQYGEPNDSYDCDYHSHSWVGLDELLAFDYEQTSFNRWATGGGMTPLREALGEFFFRDMKAIVGLTEDPKDTRVVFWFDN